MNSNDWITLGTSVAAIIAALGAILNGRSIARKTRAETRVIDAKLPVEVESIAVAGADQAVITMSRALESANKRIDELTEARRADAEERKADRKRMAELEEEVNKLRDKVSESERTSAEARKAADKLAEQLSEALREQDNRKPRR